MSETKKINGSRRATRLNRAQGAAMQSSIVAPEVVRDSTSVREERVEAARAKINDVSYNVDTDFRSAMHKLLEGLGT